MSDLLADLNSEQLQAVSHSGGPLLVVAGPGTGKTRVITRRLAYRVATGATRCERILAITFTNRAADEMRSRIRALLSDDAAPRVGTFHWMCHAILRRHIHRIGCRRDFRLLGPSEARLALHRAIAASGIADPIAASTLSSALKAIKNGVSPDVAAERHGIGLPVLQAILEAYSSEMYRANVLDLDDLLWLSAKLLRENPGVRRLCRKAYDEILVDEYQDVNPIQSQLLVHLAPDARSIVAVGDEDQAIYSWREANAQSVLRFPELFPDAETVRLRQTYRTTKRILRAARALISHNRRRIEKPLRTDNPAGEEPICYVAEDEVREADWVAAEIQRLAEQERRSWTDFVVLYRINAQSRSLEDALLRRGLPYRVHAGDRFYERFEIRHVLAYLRLALHRGDNAAVAYLLEQTPGVGIKRLSAIQEAACAGGLSLIDALDASDLVPKLPNGLRARVESLKERVAAVYQHRRGALLEVCGVAIDATLRGLADAGNVDLEAAGENLNELRSLAQEFAARKASLRTLVDRLTMGGEAASESGGVSCMTLHAAKGTEYPVVFLVGLEEGLLPHRRSLDDPENIEEERRLCYVGMTRAREHLRLSYAHSRLRGGQAQIGKVSRFVEEMGRGNVALRISPTVAARPQLTSIRPGQRVVHSRWREGTVRTVHGKGPDAMATILFDNAGEQRVQLCHAPLTLLAGEADSDLAG